MDGCGGKGFLKTAVAVVLDGLDLGTDGIYSAVLPTAPEQADEVRERVAIARREYPDLLFEVARHHSIPVMDREVRVFLRNIPAGGIVTDIGGGWGWHWRLLDVERADVCVVVVDMVRGNLRHAARLLGALVNERVFLVHGDATQLPFPSGVFDGCWSVQVLQHIPGFEQAVKEADRVLKPGGYFASYSLNRARAIELVYRVLGKSYHIEGKRPASFYLARASASQAAVVARVFGPGVIRRYSEVLFHPDLRLYTGAEASRIGAFDAHLSGGTPLLALVARQQSYHVRKSA